jgi:hypothetical protein
MLSLDQHPADLPDDIGPLVPVHAPDLSAGTR